MEKHIGIVDRDTFDYPVYLAEGQNFLEQGIFADVVGSILFDYNDFIAERITKIAVANSLETSPYPLEHAYVNRAVTMTGLSLYRIATSGKYSGLQRNAVRELTSGEDIAPEDFDEVFLNIKKCWSDHGGLRELIPVDSVEIVKYIINFMSGVKDWHHYVEFQTNKERAIYTTNGEPVATKMKTTNSTLSYRGWQLWQELKEEQQKTLERNKLFLGLESETYRPHTYPNMKRTSRSGDSMH